MVASFSDTNCYSSSSIAFLSLTRSSSPSVPPSPRRPGDDEKASWRGDNDDEDQGVWTLSTPPLCNLPLKSYDEEEEESWRDTTTKVMEEHDAEGRGAAGED
ncbi:hypothetical protein YC2023_067082 [Brassica napus]